VLSLRDIDPSESIKYVCELYPEPGGHHGGYPKAGDDTVVQDVWAVLAAAKALVAGRAGVEGATDVLY
jgi:hypothetical protein